MFLFFLLVKKCVFLYYQKNFLSQVWANNWKVFTLVLTKAYEKNNSNLFETMLFGDFE
jgi:hypothetical protein